MAAHMTNVLGKKLQEVGGVEFVRLLRVHGSLLKVSRELEVPQRELISLVYGEFLLCGLEGNLSHAYSITAQEFLKEFPTGPPFKSETNLLKKSVTKFLRCLIWLH